MAMRNTFDEVPELYDRVRPGYPEAVFDDLAGLARLVLSYTGHRALGADEREGLRACIGALMDSRFDGRIAKRHLTELTVAHPVSG